MQLSRLNLLSEGVLARVRERLTSTSWVKEVWSVEKVFPDRVKFSLVLRRPVAWISHNGSAYLADSEGVRLPVQRTSRGTGLLDEDSLRIGHLPVVTGVSRGTSLPRPGDKWKSQRVEEGICVAGYLLATPELLTGEAGKIRSIDVSDVTRRGRGVVLVTEDKKRIEWGRTRLSEKARLITDEQKLANLQLLLKGEPSLEDRSYYLLWTTPTAGPREQSADNTR